MKYLLIGGAENVGKSETIYHIANYLVNFKKFQIVVGNIPSISSTGSAPDFRCILSGNDKDGKTVKIIINSPSDTKEIIEEFKEFYDENGSNYDIMISSIRDDNFYPRNEFISIMEIPNPLPKGSYLLEIPLAKITRRTTNFRGALSWYKDKIQVLLKHTLSNLPFNL